jgi:acetyl-CoA acetyltransferase
MTTGTKAVIAGIGEVPVTPSGSGRSGDWMTVEATLAAIADAGLEPRRVDGAVKYTYDTAINTYALLAHIGADDLRFAVEVPFGGGSCAALIDVARAAIESGRAEAVVCTRTVLGDEWIKQLSTADPLRPYYMDTANYLRPVGWVGYLGIFAGCYTEYTGKHSMPREALLATINLMRANASRNRYGVETTPLSLDEYFGAPLTVGPFTRYDEFALADASCAVVVTTEDRARESGRPYVVIEASAQSNGPDPQAYFDSRAITGNEDSPATWVARSLYVESGLTPDHVDVGLVYDCTSFTLLYSTEQFGLTQPGEAATRMLAGEHAVGGALPINPHGGELAAGYTHGFRNVLEAVRQLRGEADLQVTDAEFALVGGPPASVTSGLILRKEQR